jgi:transcriptional regulator with XRE-family HTH domain
MEKFLEIGNRIQELRERLGLSKSALARKCGVTVTAVWNWEKNGIVPRSEAFALVAEALGVSEMFLRSGADTAAPAKPVRTVASIIEDARGEIASITGMPLTNVRVNVEFVSQ